MKRYGDLIAVGGIDITVQRGRCLGLLGPNGAGKTTTIEILEGLLEPDAGEVWILGRSWSNHGRDIRQRIGVQLQETRLPDKLTVLEILTTFYSLYERGTAPVEILPLVGLQEKCNVRSGQLSGGQRQRLALGCALVSNPEVLFLDEPTTGLDPQARRRVWEIVETFKARGGSVLLTTHYMDEAERLADDLIIVDHGQVIARGSPADIIDSLGAESIVRFSVDGTLESLDCTGLPGVASVRRDGDALELSVEATRDALPALLDHLRERGVGLADLRTHRPTLEDVFVALTGRHLRDE